MTDSPRARTLINLSAVLYEQSAARPSLSAEVSNIDLNFVPSVAFIPNVYIANSLRARTPINPSAVLYKQAAAQTGLPAEVSNIDLNFVPSVAFIPNVYIADSLRARTLINPSAVLYEQAAAQTGLPAKISNISLRARTLINPSAVLYEQADAQSGLPAEVSIIDLNFVPGVAFDAMGNVELTGDFPTALLNPRSLALKRPASSSSDLNCRRTDPTIERTASPAKRIKTDENRKKSTHRDDNNVQLAHTVPYPDLKKYLSNSSQQGRIKVSFRRAENNHNNLNIIVTDPTGREFSRVDIKSSTRLSIDPSFQTDQFTQQELTPREPGSIYVLRSVDKIRADVANVFDTVISKSDKVPTREPLRDNSRKFYHLVITSEDTHCKQTIKKAYIISPERASLILFMT
ncbi:hypothetical protein HBI78_013640 [Parastagonospora nodorum]|nr:hypothetical protein HBI78_013640 [Parastagonospora nodorum]